jgi:CRP-like cAMP-binding protein
MMVKRPLFDTSTPVIWQPRFLFSKEKKYTVTAQALSPNETVGWNRETMLKLMTAYPQIAINFLGMVVERLEDIQNRYLELQTERMEQRVARALLRIMK